METNLRVLLVLRRTAGSSEELLVLGRKDGAGRAMRLGKSAGKLRSGSSDSRHRD